MSVKVDVFYIVFLLCISIILTGCQNTSGLEDDTSDLSAQEVTEIVSDNPETANESNAVTEIAKAQFAYGEWYLSEWERYPIAPAEAENFDETNALYVKLPLIYEENANGLIIKVEFFQEIYTLHSLIQCRVTYTNTTGEYLAFNAKAEYTPGAFERVGTNHYHCVYRSKHFDSVYQQNVFRVGLENGESFANESVIIMEDYFFIEGYDYSFYVEVLTYDKSTPSPEYTEHKISIPVELCNPNN